MLLSPEPPRAAGSAMTTGGFDQFVSVTRIGFEVDYCAIILDGMDGWRVRAFSGEVLTVKPDTSRLLAIAIASEGATVISDTALDARVGFDAEGFRFFGAWPIIAATGERLGFFVLADSGPKSFRKSELHHMQGITTGILNTLTAEKEMSYAAIVQRALFPHNRAPLPGYDVAGCCVPTAAVGGDFYDWYPIEGGLAVTLGDVMGKGVGAGIIAARVGAVLKSAARQTNVADAVDRASETLGDELSDADSFFTLFHARIDADTGTIAYVDAGHGLSLVIGADGSSRRLAGTDFPVGMTVHHSFARHQARLLPGDMLVAVSDGVLDLYDGTLRALDRVTELARSAPSAEHFVGLIEELASLASAPDDVTAIAIMRC